MEGAMWNRIRTALIKFDDRTRGNPERMFGIVSLCVFLPFFFLAFFRPVFREIFNREYPSEYFGLLFNLITAPAVIIGSFFLSRVLKIHTEVSRKKKKDKDNLKRISEADKSEGV
jgi:hypothetical protein